MDYNNFSMALTISIGSTIDSYLWTTFPALSTKNLVKFHLIESPTKYSGNFSFKNVVN